MTKTVSERERERAKKRERNNQNWHNEKKIGIQKIKKKLTHTQHITYPHNTNTTYTHNTPHTIIGKKIGVK